jgi:hypothetical protein
MREDQTYLYLRVQSIMVALPTFELTQRSTRAAWYTWLALTSVIRSILQPSPPSIRFSPPGCTDISSSGDQQSHRLLDLKQHLLELPSLPRASRKESAQQDPTNLLKVLLLF